MTPKERAAIQQALEAIGDCSPNKALVNAAYALREALAGVNMSPTEQTEQKPVAWCYFCEDELWGFFTDPDECDTECDNEMPLYAAPVRTKDLTDDEIEAVVNAEDSKHILRDATELEIARAVIAADREKNRG